MRSVLKAKLDSNHLGDLEFDWESGSDYQKRVANMFNEIGYRNIRLDERVWEAVPEDIKNEERPRVIFSAYTSSGQAHFVVAAITKDIIHIRCVANTFFRISKACDEINKRFSEHEKKYKSKCLTGKVDPRISVLEHGQSIPTINGTIMNDSFTWCYKNTKTHCWLLVISLVLIVGGYFSIPELWEKSVFPALTVMLLTNMVPIVVEYVRIVQTRPIYWDNKIE